MVTQANSTLAKIRQAVRYYTASPSEQSLSTSAIDENINWFYNNDFAYGVKVDQMRSVYSFWTQPNIDRYPLDVNYNQGIRGPVYYDGIQGLLTKDRQEFFRMWPKWPSYFDNVISGDGSTTSFSFNVPGPFLSQEVVIGGVTTTGAAFSINDDGNGNLNLQVPNSVTTVPSQTTNVYPTGTPTPGMLNKNTSNPGLCAQYTIGTVDYVSGDMTLEFPSTLIPAADTQINIRVSQYQTGRPYSILFWNNEFTIRPIPSKIHKVEIETYLTPVQFMETTDVPILNQWADLIALGASLRILGYRQDMDGMDNLAKLYDRQQGLALERQGVEEINSRNTTIFSGSTPNSQALGFNGIGYWS